MSNETQASQPLVAEPSPGPKGSHTWRSSLAALAVLGLLTAGMFSQVLFTSGERVLSSGTQDLFLQFISII